VAGACLYTMSIHYKQLFAQRLCLHNHINLHTIKDKTINLRQKTKQNKQCVTLYNVMSVFVFFWWRFIVLSDLLTKALWSRDGSAVVSVHTPAASLGSSMYFL